MVTMADIAVRAGVSVSTVSRALKGHARISEMTCQRIQKLAREMGYRPSPLVQALMKSRRTSGKQEVATFAFITDDYGYEDWKRRPTRVEIFSGVARRSEELGYRIDTLSTKNLNLQSNQLNKVLTARGISGAIFGFSQANIPEFPFDASNLAVVGLASYFSCLALDRVKSNNAYNVEMGLRKLRERDYKKVGLVVPAYNNDLVGGDWTAAALEDARTLSQNLRCPPLVVDSDQYGNEMFFSWLDKYKPEALLVYKVPVLSFLKLRKLRPGKDIGLAWIIRDTSRNAVGVNMNYEEVGVALVDLLVSKLHTRDFGLREWSRHLLIDGYWVDGASAKKRVQTEI